MTVRFPIYLIGFMASGKSKLGKRLASELNVEFIDLDDLIEQELGRTILQLFESKGEDYFRKKEREVLKQTVKMKAVVALGGGTVCHFDNMNIVKKWGTSIYLKVEPKILFGRLKENKGNRPLVKNLSDEELRDFINQKLTVRELFYEKADHVLIDNNPTVKKIKELLCMSLGKR